MTLNVNKEAMTIMGVKFQNRKIFDAVWYAVGSSMIEDYAPTVDDIERMKSFAENKLRQL
jgi:hypothetical protein